MDQRDAVRRSIQFADAAEETRRRPFSPDQTKGGGLMAIALVLCLLAIPAGLIFALTSLF